MGKKTKRKKRGSKKKQKKSPVKGKFPFLIILVAAMVIGGYFFYHKNNQTILPQDIAVASTDIAAIRGGETKPTLTPVLFTGKTAQAYHIAKKNRDLLDSIYCFCNCKKNNGHKSLLSCYVDKHAANCGICQDQTFYANSRYQKGDNIVSIRNAVDKKFWRPLR